MQEEHAALWQAPDFDYLELLQATYITHTFDKHFHEGFAFGVFEGGRMRYFAGNATETFCRNDIIIINPRQMHYGYAGEKDGWQYRMFYPSVRLMNQIAAEISQDFITAPYFSRHLLQDVSLANLLLRAHEVLAQSQSKLERDSYLRMALGQLVIRYAVQRPQPPPIPSDERAVQLVCDYLQAHFAENVSLHDLAELVNFSPFHLLRLFRNQMGLPPHKYLTHLRIEEAKKKLLQGLPIKQIALDVGFTDQSHLTRRFKRVVGVTPGQFLGLL